VSVVRVASGFWSVVIWVGVLFLPVASLYTSFHGLAELVKLQYSFHELI
jgi:hypothetical protein